MTSLLSRSYCIVHNIFLSTLLASQLAWLMGEQPMTLSLHSTFITWTTVILMSHGDYSNDHSTNDKYTFCGLNVCWACQGAMQNWLNRSRCHLGGFWGEEGADSSGPKEQCIRWECTVAVAPPSEYDWSIYAAAVIQPIATITVATCYMYYNPARLSWKTGRRNSNNPTQPATTLRLLYRSICVSRHLQLRAEGFCWCKVLLPACPCWQKPTIKVKMLEFSSTVLSTLYPYHKSGQKLYKRCPANTECSIEAERETNFDGRRGQYSTFSWCIPACTQSSYSDLEPITQRKNIIEPDSCRAAFSALTLLVGRQEEHPACKNWGVMRIWSG